MGLATVSFSETAELCFRVSTKIRRRLSCPGSAFIILVAPKSVIRILRWKATASRTGRTTSSATATCALWKSLASPSVSTSASNTASLLERGRNFTSRPW